MKKPLDNPLLKLEPEQLELTQEDFTNGRIVFERELIKPLTLGNSFRHGIYIILSSGDNTNKLNLIYDALIDEGYTMPKDFRRSDRRLMRILRRQGWQDTKIPRIMNFAEWFVTSSLPQELIKDAKCKKKNEYELRGRIAREALGMGYKGGSLWLNQHDRKNVVCSDLWAQRYLEALGCPIKISNFKTVGAPSRKGYYTQECWLTNLAIQREVAPAIYRDAIWAKRFYWRKLVTEQSLAGKYKLAIENRL
jgi:thermostable 8-oxoguanine DNA glycosylase